MRTWVYFAGLLGAKYAFFVAVLGEWKSYILYIYSLSLKVFTCILIVIVMSTRRKVPAYLVYAGSRKIFFSVPVGYYFNHDKSEHG